MNLGLMSWVSQRTLIDRTNPLFPTLRDFRPSERGFDWEPGSEAMEKGLFAGPTSAEEELSVVEEVDDGRSCPSTDFPSQNSRDAVTCKTNATVRVVPSSANHRPEIPEDIDLNLTDDFFPRLYRLMFKPEADVARCFPQTSGGIFDRA